jgi:hypothetical protein
MRSYDPSERTDRDNRLADFADAVLKGKARRRASSDEELRVLEETILRLHKAYPPISLEKARVKQMQVRLKNRIKREGTAPQPAGWRKWFAHPQAGVFAWSVILALLFLFTAPLFSSVGSSAAGAAWTPVHGILIALGLILLIGLLYWTNRKK